MSLKYLFYFVLRRTSISHILLVWKDTMVSTCQNFHFRVNCTFNSKLVPEKSTLSLGYAICPLLWMQMKSLVCYHMLFRNASMSGMLKHVADLRYYKVLLAVFSRADLQVFCLFFNDILQESNGSPLFALHCGYARALCSFHAWGAPLMQVWVTETRTFTAGQCLIWDSIHASLW